MKLHENVKEQLQAALKSFETWGLDDLASEGASFAETMLKITKITEALMWLVPLLAGEVLADEAPSVEDLPGIYHVLTVYAKSSDLVALFVESSTDGHALSSIWEKKLRPALHTAAENLMEQAWQSLGQQKEIVLLASVSSNV